MPVGVLIPLPGVAQSDYEEVTTRIFGHYPMEPGDAPEGLLLHTAGPDEGGWYVYDVWESQEAFGRFAEANVGPTMQAVLGDRAPEVAPQFFEIASFVPAR
jgi:hypothetical protein